VLVVVARIRSLSLPVRGTAVGWAAAAGLGDATLAGLADGEAAGLTAGLTAGTALTEATALGAAAAGAAEAAGAGDAAAGGAGGEVGGAEGEVGGAEGCAAVHAAALPTTAMATTNCANHAITFELSAERLTPAFLVRVTSIGLTVRQCGQYRPAVLSMFEFLGSFVPLSPLKEIALELPLIEKSTRSRNVGVTMSAACNHRRRTEKHNNYR
jgi:hypothetical protein